MASPEYSLNQYLEDLQQQIISECELDSGGSTKEGVFTEIMLSTLSEAGELDDAEACVHRAAGLQVNGWAVSADEDSLDLIVGIHTNHIPVRTVTKDEMSAAFKKLKQFTDKAFKGYHYNIEESTKIFDVAQKIYDLSRIVSRIRFILITDGIVKSPPPADIALDQFRISHVVWDAERFFRLTSSGRERETLEINFDEIGGAIPCLVQPVVNAGYNTFLAIFPAAVLVELYARYGPRLLERNVRSFLQGKGKINTGIRNTIINEPEMFLAYNNGLSATAEVVDVIDLPDGGKGLRWIRDFQIVNGGQTTASIYHAAVKYKAVVDSIYVQAKLTVLNDPTNLDDVVPRISEYANSQNKIQTADFAANDLYHRKLEELSRTIWAPALTGTQRQSHWYYERARGQYPDDLSRELTSAKKSAFQLTNPKTQLFTKTDLAKFVNTYAMLPHIVSKGAQSSFNFFTVNLAKHVEAEGLMDRAYFERVVAKAILFRQTERIMDQCKYGGYRANLVTYTIARLVSDTKGKIDLARIWREQALSPALEQTITIISRSTWSHITNAPNNGNVTQYCKREDCWLGFLSKEIPLPLKLINEMGLIGARETSAEREHKPEAQQMIDAVTAIPIAEWMRLAAWAQEKKKLTSLQRKIVSDIVIQLGYGKSPSPRQAEDAQKILADAVNNGFKK